MENEKKQIRIDTKNDEALKLYEEGKNDAEIAEILGFAKCTVWQWRRRHGLPAQREKDKEIKRPGLIEDAIAARKAGMNYGQWKAQQRGGNLLAERMSGNLKQYPFRICLHCKHFYFNWLTQDPKSQSCKKYNKPVAMFGYAGNCEGFRKKE